jgi:3-methyladenine DNA glycosylase AlkD
MERIVIDVLKKIRLHDDATVMDSLREKGMPYDKIRGISIPELRQIAKEYYPNQELAERLWQNSTREVKILALLVADPDKMTLDVFEIWLKNFNSSEFPEQACMSFLPSTQFAKAKAYEWAKSSHLYISQTGIILAARIAQIFTEISDDYFLPFLAEIESWANIENLHIQRATARLINVLASKSLFLNDELEKLLSGLELSDKKPVKWIVQEVKWNIEFAKEKLKNE